MTDTKRAVVVFEYDDGSFRAFEFTNVNEANLTHGGLPGLASLSVTGRCQAATIAPETRVEQQFIEAIGSLAPPDRIPETPIKRWETP